MTATGSGAGGAAGRAPAADQVRNVVLVGHSGTGKSSLVEALLAATGTIQRPGSIEEGTTVRDFDEVEIRQQRSANLTLAPVVHNGIKVNLLDTPGYADFTGDLRAGLRAADSALFAVSATDGIDGVTRMLWEECAAVGSAFTFWQRVHAVYKAAKAPRDQGGSPLVRDGGDQDAGEQC